MTHPPIVSLLFMSSTTLALWWKSFVSTKDNMLHIKDALKQVAHEQWTLDMKAHTLINSKELFNLQKG